MWRLPASRVLPENPKFPKLIKKLPAFYKIRRFITEFTTDRQLSLFWNNFSHFKIFPFIPSCFLVTSFSHLCLTIPRCLFLLFSLSTTSSTRATCPAYHVVTLTIYYSSNALNCIKTTITSQHNKCYMFRPHWSIIKKHTAVHDMSRTQAAPITVFSSKLCPLHKYYILEF